MAAIPLEFVGISINTMALEARAARQYLRECESMLNLPCVDPVRTGIEPILTRMALQ